MDNMVLLNEAEIRITPVFKHVNVENVHKSEMSADGLPVMETKTVVELHFAGDRKYIPVKEITEVWKKEGTRKITFAERYADQYQAFLNGAPQIAEGTPLEALRAHGITDEQISLCRAHKVYSVESLENLEGHYAKSLGMHLNKLREAATGYRAARGDTDALHEQIRLLREQVSSLSTEEVTNLISDEAADEIANDESYGLSVDEIKARIKEKTGYAPRGNPSRESLIAQLKEAEA